MGGGRREIEGSTARSDPEDRGGRGPLPEQQQIMLIEAVSPRHCVATSELVSTAVRSRVTRTAALLLSNN